MVWAAMLGSARFMSPFYNPLVLQKQSFSPPSVSLGRCSGLPRPPSESTGGRHVFKAHPAKAHHATAAPRHFNAHSNNANGKVEKTIMHAFEVALQPSAPVSHSKPMCVSFSSVRQL